jgi:hypothetical protein
MFPVKVSKKESYSCTSYFYFLPEEFISIDTCNIFCIISSSTATFGGEGGCQAQLEEFGSLMQL